MKNLKNIIYLFIVGIIIIACQQDSIGVQDDLNLNSNELNFQKESTFLSTIPNNITPPIINKNSKTGYASIVDPRPSKRVGLLRQDLSWNSFFTTNGYTVVIIDQTFINNEGLATLDAIFYQRYASSLANSNIAALKEYVSNGGILITEWDATVNVMANFDISPNATLDDNWRYIGNATIDVNQSHPMASNLPATFISGGQTQYFKIYSDVDPNFNTVASLQTDLNSDGINEPVVATYCFGEGVWVAFFTDFGDLYDSSVDEEFTLAINMIEYSLLSCNITDFDNDGFLNDEDNHPNSNLSETITIGECNTNVANLMVGNGTFMADEVDDLIAEVWSKVGSSRYYRPQSDFTWKMYMLTSQWQYKRLITRVERNAIMQCVYGSNLFTVTPA